MQNGFENMQHDIKSMQNELGILSSFGITNLQYQMASKAPAPCQGDAHAGGVPHNTQALTVSTVIAHAVANPRPLVALRPAFLKKLEPKQPQSKAIQAETFEKKSEPKNCKQSKQSKASSQFCS